MRTRRWKRSSRMCDIWDRWYRRRNTRPFMMRSRGKRRRENMEAASLRLTSKLIYEEGNEYALHRKKTTKKYPIKKDAPRGEVFEIWMHVSSRVRQRTPARGKSATVKAIGRPKISETKRNQVGAELATDWVDEGERTALTFQLRSWMRVHTPEVDMTSVKDYAQHITANEGEIHWPIP